MSVAVGYNMGMIPDASKPKTDDQTKPNGQPESPPDGHGPRPADSNELAKWFVDQTAGDEKSSSE